MSNVEIMGQDKDIFQSGCEALVNAVNVVGVMGAGLALAFAKRYPRMENSYKKAYQRSELKLGSLHIYKNPEINLGPSDWKWIVNFPTMHFPREETRSETLLAGFKALEVFVQDKNVKSIAIPALGCGIGRFPFEQLIPIVRNFAQQVPDVKIKIYEPKMPHKSSDWC